MVRNLLWFCAGVVAAAGAIALATLIYLRAGANGLSARSEPSYWEAIAARKIRALAIPAAAKDRGNPVPESRELLDEAMAHWADHCAVCHGNDGSGQLGMGRQMYPHAPDMRKTSTQQLTDGELFYITENGIRHTGMPGWGSSPGTEKDSWKLVRFIRHLPYISPAEIEHMVKLNPISPGDQEEERAEEQFLNEQTSKEAPARDKH